MTPLAPALALAVASLVAALAAQAAPDAPPEPQQVEAATHDGGDLPQDQSALTMKVQILLDRAGVSPGVIDGWKGGMTSSALRAFEARQGLAQDGVLDPEVWQALGGPAAEALFQSYRITSEDAADIVAPLPEDYAELARRDWLGFTRLSEKLAERFHMDEDTLRAMNPGARFAPGETITVVQPGPEVEGKVTRIEVRKDVSRLAAFDAAGRMLANYPVVVGSAQMPSPSGTHDVLGVAIEPTYTYRPDVNFQQGDNDEALILPPGPNGPVGLVWIDLSEPTYGIHGTAEPAELFQQKSHGCVRLTNWDAMELAGMVGEGTVVEFVE